MTLDEFVQRLERSTAAVKWPAERVDVFLSPRFRGRDDASVDSLAGFAVGLRLGAYPVLAAVVELKDLAGMQADLKRLHAQMVIARSHMRAEEIINAHILLCAREASSQYDWRAVIDVAERDETVCRKMIWNWATGSIEASYDNFIARTFLAVPWTDVETRPNAHLDQTDSLSRRVLREAGLSPAEAGAWVRVARADTEDPAIRVTQYVDALEASR